jgi:hypothetical protein
MFKLLLSRTTNMSNNIIHKFVKSNKQRIINKRNMATEHKSSYSEIPPPPPSTGESKIMDYFRYVLMFSGICLCTYIAIQDPKLQKLENQNKDNNEIENKIMKMIDESEERQKERIKQQIEQDDKKE